jgi:hypothetical protein
MKQKTNIQLVTHMMTYSKQGVLMQAFIIEAIAKYAESVKANPLRLNPVENEAEYNAAFAQLVALESTRRTLHDLALGGL